MVRNGQVLQATLPGGENHGFHGVPTVAPVGVVVQVALDIAYLHQRRYAVFSAGLNFPDALTQLYGDKLNAQPFVNASLVREHLQLARLLVGKPIFVERQAQLVRPVSELNVVLQVAREVLKQRAEVTVLDYSQIHLNAIAQVDRRLGVAVSQDVHDVRHGHQRIQNGPGFVGGTQHIYVANRLFHAAYATANGQLANIGAPRLEGGHHTFCDRHCAGHGHPLALGPLELQLSGDVLSRLFAQAGQSGQAAVIYRLFQVWNAGDVQLLPQPANGLGAQARHLHNVQYALWELGLELVVVDQAFRFHHLGDLLRYGLSYAWYFLQVLTLAEHVVQLAGQALDSSRRLLVSANGKHLLALHLQKAGDGLELLRYLRIIHFFGFSLPTRQLHERPYRLPYPAELRPFGSSLRAIHVYCGIFLLPRTCGRKCFGFLLRACQLHD